ncbi:MAG: sigma-54-dependent Fis family transcriptional regulator [Nitrospirae bacterium]|nr:sigma-54-dependent Fis family transcriptional regulator [Nitrospirota bacterium]
MNSLPVKRTLLIIDDDKLLCDVAQRSFQPDMNVLTAHTGKDGIGLCSREKIDVVLLDQNLPDGEGSALCPAILHKNDQTKIIFITAYPDFGNAVRAIRAGAHDYLSKPFDIEELRLSVMRALRTMGLEQIEQVSHYEHMKDYSDTVLIGRGLDPVQRLIERAAASDAPVFITGETGTGKNVAARLIHYRSQVRQAPFIAINCAALPENLIEAELFGYEKGAFTGAGCSKRGVFEMAEGGTLLLDEIGEMPMALQAKLLSVLEEKRFKKLGSDSIRHVSVRVIAATNSGIDNAIKLKTFREDLYYRLGVIRIDMPPLRTRPGDIAESCAYFIKKITGTDLSLPEDEVTRLMRYPWPGNIRELKNIIERAVILQEGKYLKPSELIAAQSEHTSVDQHNKGTADTVASLQAVEKVHIRYALDVFANNYMRTARTLGISVSTLKRKIAGYGLSEKSEMSARS